MPSQPTGPLLRLYRIEDHIVDAEHVGLHSLGISTDDFYGNRMFPFGQLKGSSGIGSVLMTSGL